MLSSAPRVGQGLFNPTLEIGDVAELFDDGVAFAEEVDDLEVGGTALLVVLVEGEFATLGLFSAFGLTGT